MKKIVSLVLALAMMICAAGALAAYPEKAVECNIPWAAGGGADLAFRAFGEVWTKHTGQPFVIKNVPGASGVTGCMEFKETAIGDGYQMHVGQIVESANYLIVPADSKYQTVEDFVADVLANPGMVTVANAGVGGGNHIAALLFEEAIGGEFAHITYDGGASAVTGVLANEVNAAVCNTPEGMSNVAAGQIRILASFASKPFVDYPEVPLAKDSGVAGTENLVIEQWRSIAVPADTPDEVVAEMAEVAKKVVEDPDFVEKCNTLSIVARYRNVEETNEFVQSENTRFENLIKSKGFGDRYGK